jgi:hypothetical protein
MADSNTNKLQEMIQDFFEGRLPHIPHVSLIDNISLIGESEKTYFLVATASKDNFKDVCSLMTTLTEKGISTQSIETELVGDQYVLYALLAPKGDDPSESEIVDLVGKTNGIDAFKVKSLQTNELNPLVYPAALSDNIVPMLSISYELYHAMNRIIPTSLGSGGDYILYMSGVNVADFLWSQYNLSDFDDYEEQFAFLEDVFRSMGFGCLVFEDIDPLKSKGHIHVRNSIESCRGDRCGRWDRCESGKLYRARGTVCTFTRGLLTEMLRRIFEDTLIDLVEVSCVTKGDEECVFELTRTKEL